jgi:uncharacterized membrane protein YfcA
MLAWSSPLLATALFVSLGAGLVRGFAGFGYSALAVAGLALFVSPAAIVPAVLALEVLASGVTLRAAWHDVDAPWLRALLWGNVLAVPAGVAALALLPAPQVRLLVGGVLLLGALALRGAGAHGLRPGAGVRAGAGLASGLVNGLAASGGIVAAMLMAATHLPPRALRATMIAFLLFTPLDALAWAALWSFGGLGRLGVTAATPLLNEGTLAWMALLAPGMVLGLVIGHRAHGKADPARQRRFVLNLLVAMALLAVVRAVAGLLPT